MIQHDTPFLIKDKSLTVLNPLDGRLATGIQMIDRKFASCISSVQLIVVFRNQIEAALASTNVRSGVVCHVVGLERGFLLSNSALPYNCVICALISPQSVAVHAMECKVVATNLGRLGPLRIVVFKEE